MRVSAWQNPVRFPLTHLLGQGSHLRVLRVLSASDQPLGTGPIASGAGLTPQGTRLALEGLLAEGLVTALGAERTRLYLLDEAHPLGRVVRQLFAQESQVWQRLLAELRKLLSKDKAVLAAWVLEASPEAMRNAGVVGASPAPPGNPSTLAQVSSDPSLQLILLREKGQSLTSLRAQIQALASGMRARLGLLCPDSQELLGLVAKADGRALLLESSTPLKGPALERWLSQHPESPQPGLF